MCHCPKKIGSLPLHERLKRPFLANLALIKLPSFVKANHLSRLTSVRRLFADSPSPPTTCAWHQPLSNRAPSSKSTPPFDGLRREFVSDGGSPWLHERQAPPLLRAIATRRNNTISLTSDPRPPDLPTRGPKRFRHRLLPTDWQAVPRVSRTLEMRLHALSPNHPAPCDPDPNPLRLARVASGGDAGLSPIGPRPRATSHPASPRRNSKQAFRRASRLLVISAREAQPKSIAPDRRPWPRSNWLTERLSARSHRNLQTGRSTPVRHRARRPARDRDRPHAGYQENRQPQPRQLTCHA